MNDPSYIKDLKLQLLSAVADDSNAFEIVTELTEYVTDIDEHLAREAVRAVGRIALQVSPLLLFPAASGTLQQY
jgi:vesicle coat complex subunit